MNGTDLAREPTTGALERERRDLLAAAGALSAGMPEIVVAARQAARTVSHGLHGRRRAGPGEAFWQFRRFANGEPARRVDWRRSARDDHLYVRESEWEAAHTVWLWADVSPSMAFRSRLARASKRERAWVLALALAELLVEGGERVGLLGLTAPSTARAIATRLAETLARLDPDAAGGLPPEAPVARFCEFVVIGDLLEPAEALVARLKAIASNGARGHLVMVLDPVEETFPFEGRMEFLDPEGGRPFLAGRAESYRTVYLDRLAAHRAHLRDVCARLGWSFVVHHTDRPAHEALLVLHTLMARGGAEAGPLSASGGAS